MTQVAVAILVTDENKAAVSAAIESLTPQYGAWGFGRKCCQIDPEATWQTPATHWYGNDAGVETITVNVWQDAVDAADATPEHPLHNLKIFTVQNATNAHAWAVTNLGSEGLQFVPFEPL